MFECMLVVCLYADISVGAGRDWELDAFTELNRLSDETVELLNSPDPQGRLSLGAEYTTGRYSAYLEVTHESSLATENDRGSEYAWFGTRIRF